MEVARSTSGWDNTCAPSPITMVARRSRYIPDDSHPGARMPNSVPQQVQQQVSDLWEADLALQFMLLFLLVMLFGLLPLSGLEPIRGRGDQIAAAGFSLLGISGVFAVTRTTGARILGLVAMTAPIGLGWYDALVPGTTTALLHSALVLDRAPLDGVSHAAARVPERPHHEGATAGRHRRVPAAGDRIWRGVLDRPPAPARMRSTFRRRRPAPGTRNRASSTSA